MSNNDVVIIQLDRPRQLKFGHTAIKTLISITGKTMPEIEQELSGGGIHSDFVEYVAYAGLLKDARDNQEKLKLEDIEALLDEAPSYLHQVEKITEAWFAAFPVPETPETPLGNQLEPPAPKKESTTGTKASE